MSTPYRKEPVSLDTGHGADASSEERTEHGRGRGSEAGPIAREHAKYVGDPPEDNPLEDRRHRSPLYPACDLPAVAIRS